VWFEIPLVVWFEIPLVVWFEIPLVVWFEIPLVVWFEIPLVVEIEIPRYKSRYFVYTCMIHQRYYEPVISPTCGGLRVSIWGIWRGNV